MSSIDDTLASPIRPSFTAAPDSPESSSVQSLVRKLNLLKHPEGGYFVETDRDPLRVPNPFQTKESAVANNDTTRSACTTIYYLLTPGSPKGFFHRNKGRTIHTLHRGRGRYIIIHVDEKQDGQKARIETFVAGHDIHQGERVQWVVEGGKFKASFLLPDKEGGSESEGLLITENRLDEVYQVVVPGFEFTDHDFMPAETLPEVVSDHQADELRWLLSANP